MASQSPPQAHDTLSFPAFWLYRLGLPLTTSAIYLRSPATALFTPLVAAPTAILLHQRSSIPPPKRPANLETLLWAFLGAATVVPAVSIIAQSVLSYGSAMLVFGSQTGDYIAEFTRAADQVRSLPSDVIAKRAAMAQSLPYLAYLTFFSFSLAGLPEETFKYAVLKLISRYANPESSAGDYVIYARAIGLGFSFFENLGYIYIAAKTDTRNMLLVTAAERILYGTAAHVLTSVLSGVRMAKSAKAGREGRKEETLSWWQIIGPSVLYHGAGDALLLGACAWDGHPGWVHPETLGAFVKYLVGPVVLMTGLGMQVKREMNALGVSWVGLSI